MIGIYIKKLSNKKHKLDIYKDCRLLHSYIDAYGNLLNMCKLLVDLHKDEVIQCNININNKCIFK